MRVGGDVRLNLSIHVVGARLASVQTTGVGACAGDSYKRACLYLANRGSGQDSQQCYYAYKYILNVLHMTHRILLLGNAALKIRHDPNCAVSHDNLWLLPKPCKAWEWCRTGLLNQNRAASPPDWRVIHPNCCLGQYGLFLTYRAIRAGNGAVFFNRHQRFFCMS